jgi:hypothetical protein
VVALTYPLMQATRRAITKMNANIPLSIVFHVATIKIKLINNNNRYLNKFT